MENAENNSFYEKLQHEFYRSERKSQILTRDAVYSEKDTFNIVDIPTNWKNKKRIILKPLNTNVFSGFLYFSYIFLKYLPKVYKKWYNRI